MRLRRGTGLHSAESRQLKKHCSGERLAPAPGVLERRIPDRARRKGLVDRGFVEKTKADADVLLSYDLGAYAAAAVSGRSSMAKREGGITVWVYDRKTGDQIWYGWSERPLSPEDEPEPTINASVDAIFQDRMPQNQ